MILTQRTGDNITHKIELNWANRAFNPDGYNLIFTVKALITDSDANAKIQKELGTGITVSGTTALVELLHVDTAGDALNDPIIPALAAGKYVWDIQATLTVDAEITEIKTVASGTLDLIQDVTRALETSIPIYTYDPTSSEGVANLIHASTSKTTPVDADELTLVDSTASWVLKKLTWANLKATAKTYFDTLYVADSFSAVSSSNRLLMDSQENVSVNWDTREAYAANGFVTMFWGEYLLDDGWSTSLDWYNRTLYDYTTSSLDWLNRILMNSSGVPVVYWDVLEMHDSDDLTSISWGIRQLMGSDGITPMLDWNGLDIVMGADMDANYFNINNVTAVNCDNVTGVWVYGDYLYAGIGITGASGFGAPNFPNGAIMSGGLDMVGNSIYAGWITGPSGNEPIELSSGAIFTPTAVASLSGTFEGTVAYVNNALAPSIGATVAGGGSAKCLVCYNGTNWKVTSLL